MTDKIFDQFIQDKLKEHSSPVPEDMFDRIIKTDDPKRRIALFSSKTIISVFLLVAVSSLIGYIMWQPANTNSLNAKNEASVNTSFNGHTQNDGTIHANTIPGKNDQIIGEEPEKEAAEANNNSTGAGTFFPSKSEQAIVKEQTTTPAEVILQNQQPLIEKNIDTHDYSLADFNKKQLLLYSVIAQKDRDINISAKEQLLNQLKLMKLAGLVDCPTRWPRRDWYIEVFGSPDFAKKSIIRNNSINENYYNRKDSTESMEGAFTAGIRISKTLNDHILLKSGLQYSQINEQFKYRTENERRLTTVVTIRTIIRAPGDTVRIRDTSMLEQIGYRQQITHNRYRSIDVPVILSYEWGGEKWKNSINAGVLLNLRSWQQGEMLDTSYIPVSFNKPTGQTFKTNIGVGLYLGYSVFKSIGGKMDVFAEPYFRYNVSNMTTDKSLFTQKFNVAGLNLGIRYKLSTTRQHYYGR